ncbi:sec-independent translocase [Propionicicella superfundia]|uniref:sec-independent translocase n=1 Tax=Propionicicella superfundia TaxID=348582 RepID=UPI0004182869|nr:sec-independent translocase [Propionicicella superfundia]
MGGTEIFFLVVLGVVIFGPEKLPDLARKSARVVHYLRGVANNARHTLNDELGPEFAGMDLGDLNPRTFVQKHLLAEGEPVTQEIRSLADDIKAPVPAPPRPPVRPAFDSEAT